MNLDAANDVQLGFAPVVTGPEVGDLYDGTVANMVMSDHTKCRQHNNDLC